MEIIRGKHTSFIGSSALADSVTRYNPIHIDIGTGDGRFVRHLASAHPNGFAIGIDAARENLVEVSRRAPANALFVIANALALPPELDGLAASVTVNFPWGSLLDGLLLADPALLRGLVAVMRPGAALDVRLNAGALVEAGWPLEQGAERVQAVLTSNGFTVEAPRALAACDLKAFPTTWAKRLAFGRDPRAIHLRASWRS